MGEVDLERKRSSFRVSGNYLGWAVCGEMNSRQVRRRLGGWEFRFRPAAGPWG